MTELIRKGKIRTNINPDIYINYKKLSEILINRVGDCVQRPGLFAGMCRLLKVPNRILLVFVYPEYWKNQSGYLNGAHGINEIYDPVYKEWIQTHIVGASKQWINHDYSIPCGYYTREDKPDNYLNLMFLNQDAIKLGDTTACKWKFAYAD